MTIRYLPFTAVTVFALGVAPLAAQAKPIVGKPSPDFQITLVDKSRVDFAALKGQVVVINFWATWCVPCRTELPLLDAYYRRLEKHGLRVFAITTQDSVPDSQLKKLFAALAISSARKITGGYSVMNGVPTNFVIDRRGVVRYAKAGALELDDLNREIVPLLNEPTI